MSKDTAQNMIDDTPEIASDEEYDEWEKMMIEEGILDSDDKTTSKKKKR